MIIVCLDDTKPVTREDISWGTWVGDGRNRFYDKHQCTSISSSAFSLLVHTKATSSFTVIVYDNGRSGFLGEHSCMDGTPTLRMNEFMLATIAHNKIDLGPVRTSEIGKDLPDPVELKFDVDDKVKTLVKEAEQRFDELVGAHNLEVSSAY